MEFGCFKNPRKVEVKKDIYKYNFNRKIKNNDFSIKQTQLNFQPNFYVKNKMDSSKVVESFKGEYIENKSFNSQNPALLLSIKDNSDLLKLTLNNLHTYKINNVANILIIDDRPSDESNKNIAIDFGCSYLKTTNSQNVFNFSMLHNLAVHILYQKHKDLKTIILWNSDLWTKDSNTLPELLKLHQEEQSTISGTKLLYPDEDCPYSIPEKANMVQFGGSMFGPRPNYYGLFPLHLYRGYESNNEKVNCNKGEMFITGAFMIIDAKWFIKSGGFCPLYQVCFQDVDLCLRGCLYGKKIFYFGKDLELYHYESYTRGLKDEKLDQRTDLDSGIYTSMWPYERIYKLLFQFS